MPNFSVYISISEVEECDSAESNLADSGGKTKYFNLFQRASDQLLRLKLAPACAMDISLQGAVYSGDLNRCFIYPGAAPLDTPEMHGLSLDPGPASPLTDQLSYPARGVENRAYDASGRLPISNIGVALPSL